MEKSEARETALSKRLSLPEKKIDELSKIIQERLMRSEFWPSSGRIGLYASNKNEVKTNDLFQYALEKGLHVYFPRVEQGIQFYEVNGPEDLQRGAWGVPEPIPKICEPLPEDAQIDLLVVPGIVFSKNGYRLGYGRGFYDRFLKEGIVKKSVGLAYEFQITEKIEPETWDQPVDMVFTERHTFLAKDFS